LNSSKAHLIITFLPDKNKLFFLLNVFTFGLSNPIVEDNNASHSLFIEGVIGCHPVRLGKIIGGIP
jgi:hypothetical protein